MKRRRLAEVVMSIRLLLCVAGMVSVLPLAFAGAQREPVPDQLVVLTFDDAKASHDTVVRPLLKP